MPGDSSDIFLRTLLWSGFVLFVLVMLFLDLFVVNRKAHAISAKESLRWTGVTIALALLFSVFVYFAYENRWLGLNPEAYHIKGGRSAVIQYLTGWVIEYSLSLDNLFVIMVIFAYFRVPAEFQHRVLFWGIMGALVMRGVMIGAGAWLIHYFDWTLLVFGAILLLTAFRLMVMGDSDPEPEKNPAVRILSRIMPISGQYDGRKFFTRRAPAPGAAVRLMATPLFVVLLVVESTDVIFAVDSIPAIFGITEDPFLVFSSNVFAILGLRSLFFAVAHVIHRFRYMKVALVFVLMFIGVKLLLHEHKMPEWLSFCIVVGTLGAGVVFSLVLPAPEPGERVTPLEDIAAVAEATWKRTRKWIILFIGGTIVLVGVILLVLPGPGIPLMIVGLGLLATEFVWAAAVLNRLKKEALRLKNAGQRMVGLGGGAADKAATPGPSADETTPSRRG